MSWMKYVQVLSFSRVENSNAIDLAIKKAEKNNLNYVIFNGEMITLSQAKGIYNLLTDDKLRRETDIDVQFECPESDY